MNLLAVVGSLTILALMKLADSTELSGCKQELDEPGLDEVSRQH